METTELKEFVGNTQKRFDETNKAITELRSEFKSGNLEDALGKDKAEKLNKFLDGQDEFSHEILAERKASKERLEKQENEIAELKAAVDSGGYGDNTKDSKERYEYKKAYSLFMAQGMRAGEDSLKTLRDIGGEDEFKTLTSATTSAGYNIREDFLPKISDKVKEVNKIRSVAQIQTIGSSELEIQVQTGDIGTGWVNEGAARTESTNPTFRRVVIKPEILHSEVYVTQEMIEDNKVAFGGLSDNFIGWLMNEQAKKFARDESIAFVSGNGTGQPRGVMDKTGTDGVNNIASQANLTTSTSGTGARLVTPQLLAEALHDLTPEYMYNAVWGFNNNSLKNIRLFEDGDGRWVFQPGMMGTTPVPNTVFGQPYIVNVDMDSDGASGKYPVVVGDWEEGYVIGDRVGMQTLEDPFTRDNNGLIRYRARKRVGGSIIRPDAFRTIYTGA